MNFFQIIVNIAFVVLFACVLVFLYSIFGKNNFEVLKKSTKQAYENKLQEIPAQRPEEKEKAQLPEFNKYNFKYNYELEINGFIRELQIKIPLPQDENEKQYISDFNITPKPYKMYNDGINTFAEYDMEGIEDQVISIQLEGVANVRTYNLDTAKIINKNLTPENDLSRYLQPENLIESNDSMIVNIAKKIKGNTKEEIVKNIYEYVQKNINYKPISGALGAKRALLQKEGKCTEYTAAMVALCRAKGIPARVLLGNIARESGNNQHEWVEVYYDDYGWVMYDPTTRATVVKILDAQGNLIREEKRYDTSTDIKYILSGRNIS